MVVIVQYTIMSPTFMELPSMQSLTFTVSPFAKVGTMLSPLTVRYRYSGMASTKTGAATEKSSSPRIGRLI